MATTVGASLVATTALSWSPAGATTSDSKQPPVMVVIPDDAPVNAAPSDVVPADAEPPEPVAPQADAATAGSAVIAIFSCVGKSGDILLIQYSAADRPVTINSPKKRLLDSAVIEAKDQEVDTSLSLINVFDKRPDTVFGLYQEFGGVGPSLSAGTVFLCFSGGSWHRIC